MATVTSSKRHLVLTSDTYTSNEDVVVGGNLTVQGTTTTLDTANLLVEDKNIIIGNVSSPSDTTADGGGITLKGASDYTINWSNANNRWDFNQGIHSSGNITGSNLSGTNTGDQVLPTDFVSKANGGTFSGDVTINGDLLLGNTAQDPKNVVISQIGADNSETTSLMLDGNGVVVTRNLGSGAFAANPTNYLTDDAFDTGVGLYLTGGSYNAGTDTATTPLVIDEGDFIKTKDGGYLRNLIGKTTGDEIQIGASGTSLIDTINFLPGNAGNSAVKINNNTIWNAGNDGAGSGLDADLLDGQHASAFSTATGVADNADVTPSWVPSSDPGYLTSLSGAVLTTGNQTITGVKNFTGELHWDLSSGEYAGDPRAVVMGYSGGNYGQLGYNIDFSTTSNTHTRVFNDIPTRMDLYDGILLYSSAAGSAGTSITWTELLQCQTNNFEYKGQDIYHTGNNSGILNSNVTLSSLGAQAAGSYAAASHNHAASEITSGTLSTSRLDSSVIFGNNSSGTNEGNFTNWNNLSKTGFYSDDGATGKWTTSNWSSVMHFRLYDDNNNYASQLGFDTYNSDFYYRMKNNGTWTSWYEVYHEGHKPTWSEIESKPSTFAPSSHNHDDRYYTETEIDNFGFLTSSSTQSKYLRSDANDTTTGSLTIGNGSADTRLIIKRVDGTEADDIQFFNGTTRVGEIGTKDTTWLRINQETAKNIFTPRYIRADGGFFVDGTSKGINGSGNFIGGTITGASDASVSNWDTAYEWGNHASAGYSTTNTTYSAGNGLTLSGTVFSANINYISTSGTNNYIELGSNSVGTEIPTSARIAYKYPSNDNVVHFGEVDDLPFATTSHTHSNYITSNANDNVTGHTEWQDNYHVRLGNSADMRLYHTSGNSYIDNNTGSLYIRANVAADVGGNIHLRPHDNENGIIIKHDAEVELYHNNALKMETTSGGISVQGSVAASGGNVGNLNTSSDIGQQMEYGSTSTATLRCDADRWRVYFGGGGQAREAFSVLETGNVGIGDSTPSYKLDVNGTIRATGDVIAYSDERVKENIKTIDNSLEKVNKLRGVEFNKIGEDKKSIGVIAQEIEKVLPEVVRTDGEGMKSVAYGNVVGVLIEAIKELNKEVEELKKSKCKCNGNNL